MPWRRPSRGDGIRISSPRRLMVPASGGSTRTGSSSACSYQRRSRRARRGLRRQRRQDSRCRWRARRESFGDATQAQIGQPSATLAGDTHARRPLRVAGSMLMCSPRHPRGGGPLTDGGRRVWSHQPDDALSSSCCAIDVRDRYVSFAATVVTCLSRYPPERLLTACKNTTALSIRGDHSVSETLSYLVATMAPGVIDTEWSRVAETVVFYTG